MSGTENLKEFCKQPRSNHRFKYCKEYLRPLVPRMTQVKLATENKDKPLRPILRYSTTTRLCKAHKNYNKLQIIFMPNSRTSHSPLRATEINNINSVVRSSPPRTSTSSIRDRNQKYESDSTPQSPEEAQVDDGYGVRASRQKQRDRELSA